MEEKKLTDEEIVKAIDVCMKTTSLPLQCKNGCPYYKDGKPSCIKDDAFYKDVMGLIHRLQAENAEQKAEIERVKSFIDFKAANVMCDKCKQQAVKDTAKEIYRKAEKKAHFKDGGHYDKDRYLLDMTDLKGIVNGYGVEVE